MCIGDRRLTPKAEVSVSEILFSVRDSGIGIPKSSQARIFSPFVQAENGNKNAGSGLGLTISKRLTELMGGKMWFESEENRGSTFYFTLITKR
jgi:signal transduction histidine kinase